MFGAVLGERASESLGRRAVGGVLGEYLEDLYLMNLGTASSLSDRSARISPDYLADIPDPSYSQVIAVYPMTWSTGTHETADLLSSLGPSST